MLEARYWVKELYFGLMRRSPIEKKVSSRPSNSDEDSAGEDDEEEKKV